MSRLDVRPWPMRFLVLGVCLYLAGVLVTVLQLRSYEMATLFAFGANVAIGALIIVRRPGNVIGPALVAYGTIWSLKTAAMVTAETFDEAGRLDAAAWATLVSAAPGASSIWLVSAIWLLFPDGHTSSSLNRRLLKGSGAVAVIATVAGVLGTPQALPETKPYPHPFIDEAVAETIYDVVEPLAVLIFFFGYVVAGRLVVEKRRGNPVERRQAGWIAVAAILNITILMGNVTLAPLGTDDRAFLLIDAVAVILVPLAVGVAIMRYRLYEIDRIISRSVTFGLLAAFIAAVYVGVVVGLGEILGGDAGFGLSIAATVLVAVLFQPVRRRVEHWASRLVYGERSTPHEILVRFSHRASELSDDALIERIPQLIVDGTGAKTAALWIRSRDGFRTASTWPPDAATRSLDAANTDEFVVAGADHAIPVIHDGELLGGLSLVKEPGDAVTPAESILLSDLASGLSLALRNARLTEQLRNQVAELEASRERVLAAADEARRELEHTLDSGPQQQLVALKVKLGPTRKRAEQLGATKTATLLGQLEQQAGEAIASIRAFAGGVYPPLLEAEGLAVAIGQQSRGGPVRVTVQCDDVARFPREVESAVYFTVLEALQNTTKYANAGTATVNLSATDDALRFEVVDDGDGFDTSAVTQGAGLNGIVDRLDTVGGQVTISSRLSHGTTVVGTVPTNGAAAR